MSGTYTGNKDAQMGVTMAISILAVIDLIGNSLVIMVIMTNISMKSSMNYLLVNLAIADIVLGLFLTPRFVFNQFFTHPDGLAGNLTCKFVTAGNLACIGAASSIITLGAICFERYFAVVHPYSRKLKLTVQRVKIIAAGSWVFAVLLNTPLFITMYYDKTINSCAEEWPKRHMWLASAYSTVWFAFAGIIPVTIMIVLYSRVIYTLWFKHSEHQVQGAQLAMLKSRKRVTKLVVTVSVIYAVSWLPEETVYLLHHYNNPLNNYNDVVYNICVVLAMFNSSINPFIYTFQSSKFRTCLMKLIRLKKCRSNRVAIHGSGAFNKDPKTHTVMASGTPPENDRTNSDTVILRRQGRIQDRGAVGVHTRP